MSKKEDNSTMKQTSHTSQRKLSANIKQKTNIVEISSDKRLKTESAEDFRSKGSRTERSFSTEDPNILEKHTELAKQIKIFYDKFTNYAVNQENKDKLAKVIKDDREEDPVQLVKSMTQMIKVLVKTSQKDKNKTMNSSMEEKQRNDYEELLQKAENDIRQHIRIEQQLKLLIDNMQAKLDEYEKNEEDQDAGEIKALLTDTKADNAKLIDKVKQREQEINNFQKMLKQKDQTIRSYEEKVLTITILEHKLASLNEKYIKEKEGIRNYYDQEFANLTKEIQHMHRVLAINLPNDDKMKLLQEELLSYKDFNVKKVHILENKLKQLEEHPINCEKDDTETDFALHTDPGHGDRRMSARPSTTATSVMKSRGYDVSSHRCSTEACNKSIENKSATNKPSSAKKREIISQLKAAAAPILSARTMSKGNIKTEQPQQAPKSQRDVENYFQYLKKRLDNIQGTDKEKEHLRSFDARRSSSVKKGAYLAGSAGIRRDKSSDKISRVDVSKGIDDRTECFSSERQHRKSVPKLRTATNTLHTRTFKI